MEMLKNKKVLLGGAGIIVLFVLYQAFLKPVDRTAQFLETSAARNISGPSREIAELLASVQSIRIDDQLFRDAAFNSLVDFSVPLTPEPVGRPNPFSPLSGTSGTPSGSPQ